MTKPSKILIVGPAWVGDMVMAQTLFRHLKHTNPGVQIDVLAPKYTGALLQRMPEVAEHLDAPLAHGELALSKRRAIGKSLSDKGYQQAIVLPNSFKSALIPFWAGIPLRTGYQGEVRFGILNDRRKLNKARLPLMIQRFVMLGEPADAKVINDPPWPRLLVEPEQKKNILREVAGIDDDTPLLALCPGAEYGPAKQWPLVHFAGIARDWSAKGYKVAVLGSAKEQAAAKQICDAVPAALDLAGKTSLGQAVDLLSAAAAVVTNDSGLMHIAASVETPVVALYGSSSPGFTPPLAKQVEILQLDLPCRPCFERTCPLKHKDCLTKIYPQQVTDALDRILEEGRG